MTGWPTIKVPQEDYDLAQDYKPEDATWGDCLVAGAERLNENLDSDFDVTATVTPTLDEEAMDELFDELESIKESAAFEPLDAPEWDLDGVRATLSTLEDRTARIENQLDKIQRGKLEDLEGRR